MGKAYSEEQKKLVKSLLENGRDEETIEKETGVSDRTIRRWKLDLERTGRIGKPPESRTGRHRVLTPEVESALFEVVKANPRMSVDDMLWWLHDKFDIVVGTRTIRRVFERNPDKGKVGKTQNEGSLKTSTFGRAENGEEQVEENVAMAGLASTVHPDSDPALPYSSLKRHTEQQLAQALDPLSEAVQPLCAHLDDDLPDDEEIVQLQLQQIALQKRELELKLKIRRIQQAKAQGITLAEKSASTPTAQQSVPSTLYNPAAVANTPTPPKRDSRSKKKIEESKKRTAERQERMLRDLERRSRRRDHLTAEWVQSKDIWPLRAQGFLAELMHRHAYYTPSGNTIDTFEAMYRELYQLVDHSKGDWNPAEHDDKLRERMKRKMGQLRTKMQKTGEIIGHGDACGMWQKADDYMGIQAGNMVGDDSELPDTLQVQSGVAGVQDPQQMQYDPISEFI